MLCTLDTAPACVVCSLIMTKTLYHVTPRLRMESIEQYGLCVCLSEGKTRGVWLCDAYRLPWAVHHVSKHQRKKPEDMSILHVNVNGLKLRTIRAGVYVSGEDIATSRIFDCNYFAIGEPE